MIRFKPRKRNIIQKIRQVLFERKIKKAGGDPTAYNSFRVFFYHLGCPYCKMVYGVIERLNSRLRPGKQIATVNIYSKDPRVQIINPDVVPFIYLDGHVVKGVTSRIYIQEFLKSFMRDKGDYIEKGKYC